MTILPLALLTTSSSLRVINLFEVLFQLGKISLMFQLVFQVQPSPLTLASKKEHGIWLACSQGNLAGGSHRLALQFEKSQHLASRGMLGPTYVHTSCH